MFIFVGVGWRPIPNRLRSFHSSRKDVFGKTHTCTHAWRSSLGRVGQNGKTCGLWACVRSESGHGTLLHCSIGHNNSFTSLGPTCCCCCCCCCVRASFPGWIGPSSSIRYPFSAYTHGVARNLANLTDICVPDSFPRPATGHPRGAMRNLASSSGLGGRNHRVNTPWNNFNPISRLEVSHRGCFGYPIATRRRSSITAYTSLRPKGRSHAGMSSRNNFIVGSETLGFESAYTMCRASKLSIYSAAAAMLSGISRMPIRIPISCQARK